MARIERIKLSGWMPFASEHDVALPAGPIAVVATYRSNPRRSNWAGKTSLIEAVTWCLFGSHRKRLDDGVINNSCDECIVELDLGDGVIARRSRKRGSSTVFTITVDGESRRGSAAQQLLVERLGVTLEDYEATVSFRQDDIESIVGLRAGMRREIISTWLRLERWTHAAKKASERSRKALQRLGELRAARTTLAATHVSVDTTERMRGEQIADDLDDALRKLRARAAEIDRELAGSDAVDELERQLQELARLRATIAELRPQLLSRAPVQREFDQASDALGAAASALDAATKRDAEILRIRSREFDGLCPITCKSCPVADEVQAEVASSATLRAAAMSERERATAAKRAAEGVVERLRSRLRTLDQVAGSYNAAMERGKELRALVGDRSIADVEAARVALVRLRERKSEIAVEIEQHVREQAKVLAVLDASKRTSAELARLDLELVAAEREVRISALMVRALGPTGVPARIARAHIETLESSANELLVDSGLSLEFAWERATKDRTPTCIECGHIYVGQRDKKCPHCGAERGQKMSDELEIMVDDGSGEIEDVKAKSGGAKVLVASALRLAAAAMLREVRGASIAWATIDEPFGPLDSELREALARVFSGMLGSVGLEQAFVVSHDQALLDSLPSKLVIERADGASTFRLEAA
jgi:DNA repair exonuclease SbcCD ATPase subunit